MAQTIEPVTATEELLYAVKRIETVSTDGSQGSGTGYVFSTFLDSTTIVPTLVTNKHVVEGSQFIKVTFHTADLMPEQPARLDGRLTQLVLTKNNTVLVEHPDPEIDLVAILWAQATHNWHAQNPGKTLFLRSLHEAEVWPEDKMPSLDAAEQVIMVGCPNSLWDEVNGYPLFRQGITASHPAIDFRGRPEIAVDIGVFSGSSGSPVFLISSGLIRSKGSTSFTPMVRFGLLGTLWGGPMVNEQGKLVVEPVPTSWGPIVETRVRMHLGYVIKARETIKLMEQVKRLIRPNG